MTRSLKLFQLHLIGTVLSVLHSVRVRPLIRCRYPTFLKPHSTTTSTTEKITPLPLHVLRWSCATKLKRIHLLHILE